MLPSKQATLAIATVRNAKDVQSDNHHQDTTYHKIMKKTRTRSSRWDLIVRVRGLDITGKFGASIFHGRHIPDWNCMRILGSNVWSNPIWIYWFGTGVFICRLDWRRNCMISLCLTVTQILNFSLRFQKFFFRSSNTIFTCLHHQLPPSQLT